MRETDHWVATARLSPDATIQSLPRCGVAAPAFSVAEVRREWDRWRSRPHCPAEILLKLGGAALNHGEPILAYDILSREPEAVAGQPDPMASEEPLRLRLRQLSALALAQSGATRRAGQVLEQLHQEGNEDPETLGILGRVHKDLARAAPTELERQAEYRKSLACYLEGFEKSDTLYRRSPGGSHAADAYYCGINAATLRVLLGDLPEARRTASRVREICEAQVALSKEGGPTYWLLATLGEAELIAGRLAQASRWYQAAVKEAGGNWRELSSTRRQARLLARCLGQSTEVLDALFPDLTLVVFAGRDGAGGDRQPDETLADCLRTDFGRRLHNTGIIAGYLSGVSPATLIFGEALLEHGAEAHWVLPYHREQCRRLLDPIPERQARFDHLLARAASIADAAERSCLDERVNARFAALHAYGSARLRAARLDATLELWGLPEAPGRYDDDGSFLLAHWRRLGCSWQTLDMPARVLLPPAVPPDSARSEAPVDLHGSHDIVAMLFADVKDYSQLNDPALLRFSLFFLGSVAGVLETHTPGIISRRTAGDGLFIVFRTLEAAVAAAMALRDLVAGADWEALGLPALGIRISLDAGPVYIISNAMSQGLDVCGRYANRAARIEPVTPPNEVYASETFTSLYVAGGNTAFAFEYVGQTQLPKGFGFTPLYRVGRNQKTCP